MHEYTATPCFPLRPSAQIEGRPTNAPVEPCYPRLTVHYSSALKAIEVGFYGPEAGTIHILTPAQAANLAEMLADVALRDTFAQINEAFVKRTPAEMNGILRALMPSGDPLPRLGFNAAGAAVVDAALEAEYPARYREAEGA